jgi:hypothetical protein
MADEISLNKDPKDFSMSIYSYFLDIALILIPLLLVLTSFILLVLDSRVPPPLAAITLVSVILSPLVLVGIKAQTIYNHFSKKSRR